MTFFIGALVGDKKNGRSAAVRKIKPYFMADKNKQ